MDDDMLRLYCNEDLVVVDIDSAEDSNGGIVVTLTEERAPGQHFTSS